MDKMIMGNFVSLSIAPPSSAFERAVFFFFCLAAAYKFIRSGLFLATTSSAPLSKTLSGILHTSPYQI